MDEVIHYFVVHNFVVNGDSYTGSMIHNYYLYEEDGQLSMIPWDYNLAYGTFQGSDANGSVNDPIDTPLSATGSGDRPMADWIFSNEEYTQMYHQYFAEFLNSVDVVAMIEEAQSLIVPYVEKHLRCPRAAKHKKLLAIRVCSVYNQNRTNIRLEGAEGGSKSNLHCN